MAAKKKLLRDATLEEFYIGLALAGILAAQFKEPDREWAAEWAELMGAKLAAKVAQMGGAR